MTPSKTHLVLIPSYNPGRKVFETVQGARAQWNPVWVVIDGSTDGSEVELLRMAVPRRVYTMSHFEYDTDRITWLYKHRDLVQGLKFVQEPPVLRFFFGRLDAIDNWSAKLAEAFEGAPQPRLLCAATANVNGPRIGGRCG